MKQRMKLRILFVCLIVLGGVGSLLAQVKVGVQAGANVSGFASSSSMPAENSSQMGYQLGVTADYEFNNHLVLTSGLSFIRRNGKLELGQNYYPSDGSFMRFPRVETAVNYLQSPLTVGYRFHCGDGFSLTPCVGLYAAYGLGAGSCALDVKAENGEISSEGWKPLQGNREHGLNGLRRWDWGGTAVLKAIIGRHYMAELSYSLGIMKAQTMYGLRNSTFQLSVGYRF